MISPQDLSKEPDLCTLSEYQMDRRNLNIGRILFHKESINKKGIKIQQKCSLLHLKSIALKST